MTLQEILEQIQVQLEISNDEIDWEDDETKAKITLVNSAILTWATAQNTVWEELLNVEELGKISAGRNEFSLPRKVRFVEDFWAGNYQNIPIYNAQKAITRRSGAYIQGNSKKGRMIVLAGEIPAGSPMIGESVSALCLFQPTLLKNPEDRPEMSDPTFIVDFVCAAIATDDDQSKYPVFSTNYATKLTQMIQRNEDKMYESMLDSSDLVIGE